MEIVNNYGSALGLTPVDYNFQGSGYGLHHTQSNTNKLYFFTDLNVMDNTLLFEVGDETELLALVGDNLVGSVEGFGLDYLYNVDKKERIIKQNPVDAYRFDALINGDIAWFAMRIKVEGTTEHFIFSDEVGTFDNPSSVNLDYLNNEIDKENIVTSIKFLVRDKATLEV